MPPAEGVADTVPRLLWWLSQLEELELEALRGGAGNVKSPAEGIVDHGIKCRTNDPPSRNQIISSATDLGSSRPNAGQRFRGY